MLMRQAEWLLFLLTEYLAGSLQIAGGNVGNSNRVRCLFA
jgi:hypothetical protein